jgi:hypothetical protein
VLDFVTTGKKYENVTQRLLRVNTKGGLNSGIGIVLPTGRAFLSVEYDLDWETASRNIDHRAIVEETRELL